MQLKKNNLSNCFFLILLGVLLISLLLFYSYYEKKHIVQDTTTANDYCLQFSEENSFQEQDFSVIISPAKEVQDYHLAIHYTLDGTTPTSTSPLYTEPLFFSVTEDTSVYILKAAVCYQNMMGPVLTKTYFCSKTISDRFHTAVLSLSIDESDLYDETTGIYTNYMERDSEWIKPAHIEYFDQNGNCLINQSIGMGVSGVTSASYEIKPFKLEAGTTWDKKSKFDNILSCKLPEGGFTLLSSLEQLDHINTLKLKNGGSGDFYASRLREVVGMKLAKEAGLSPVIDYQPVVVYLNGFYYDFMQISENTSANNLSKLYSLEEDNISIFKESERALVSEFAQKEYLLTADYNNPDVIADFEATFDKENLFLYYAIQLLEGNTDWPQNNTGAWQYTGTPIPDNPYSDGRIRFLLFDLSNNYRIDSEREIFDDLFNNPLETKAWLSHILQNPEYKRYFVNLLCDLLSTTFDTEHIISLVDEEYAQRQAEDSILTELSLGTISSLASSRQESVDSFKSKVDERIWFIRKAMTEYFSADYFNPDAKYTLSIELPDTGVSIQCNTLILSPEKKQYEGLYYKNYPVLLQATSYPGYAFDYWIINGEKQTDSTIFIMPELVTNDNVTVEVAYHPVEGTIPVIADLSVSGGNDYLTISNPYTNEIYLGTYYLSNDINNLTRYQLPKISLAPGEEITLQDKNCFSLGGYYMNINLRNGTSLYLSDASHIVDSVFIPKMNTDTIYSRYPLGTHWCWRNKSY